MTYGCEDGGCQKPGKYRPNSGAWLCDDHAGQWPDKPPKLGHALLLIALAGVVLGVVLLFFPQTGAGQAKGSMVGNGGAPRMEPFDR